MARPSSFNQDMAQRICDEVAAGSNLSQICLQDGFPDRATVYKWMREREEFFNDYTRAREARADHRADRIDELSRKVEAGLLDYNAARVIIDAHKWQAAHEAPKTYGERDRSASVTVDLSGLHITALQQRTTPQHLVDAPKSLTD